jgi:type IV secretory pathway VirB4 component
MAKGTALATQEFVPIQEIRDGVVILKDGTMRMALLVSSINFALKSADEQTAILLQFQNFLNSLDFYIQIFVQSRRLDIRPYLRTLEERLVAQTTDLMKVQVKEYIEFIRKFTETTDIMSKSFFVIIPYTPPILGAIQKGGFLNTVLPNRKKSSAQTKAAAGRVDDFDEHRMQIEQRAAVIGQGFGAIGLRVAQLGTEELVELYFKMFNPGETDIPNLG